MNTELEKILNKLEKMMFGAEAYNDDFNGTYIGNLLCLGDVRAVLEDYMNDGWIPVEERLPEEHSSIFAKFKGTTKWNNAMFETCSNEVNITIEDDEGKSVTAHAHTNDGKWKCDLLRLNPQYHVTAWRPLPEPYKPERSEV